jgi:hypothetical protein
MKKKTIIFIALILVALFTAFKWNKLKTYFIEEKYYSVLSTLRITKPHYKPYKNFYEIFTEEGFSYNKNNSKIIHSSLDKLKNITQQPDKFTIPMITHQVYFTPANSTKKLDDFYIENLKLSFEKLGKFGNWQHNIWTNNPALFSSISNANIRNINEFKDHPLYKNLQAMLLNGAESKAYLAESSDLVRLMALQKFGGIYKDMDYEIYNVEAFFNMMKKFDFIGGRERLSIKSYYGNSFIATKPNHPVINQAMKNLIRNHNLNESTPNYLKYPSMEFDRIYFNGPPLITIAYFAKNNLDGNADLILPPWMIYNVNFAHTKNKYCNFSAITKEEFYQNNANLGKLITDFTTNSKDEIPNDGKITNAEQNIYYNTKYRSQYEIIGADMFCGSWVAGNKFKRNFYWNIPLTKKN